MSEKGGGKFSALLVAIRNVTFWPLIWSTVDPCLSKECSHRAQPCVTKTL